MIGCVTLALTQLANQSTLIEYFRKLNLENQYLFQTLRTLTSSFCINVKVRKRKIQLLAQMGPIAFSAESPCV